MSSELLRLTTDGYDLAAHTELLEGVHCAKTAGEQVDFPDEAHDVLAEVEDSSLWFLSRNHFIEDALRSEGMPRSLWDVGSGNGTVALHLQRAGVDVVAVEPSLAGARRARDRGVRVSIAGTLEALQLPDDSLEAIGMFDVVEHLEFPEDLLREVRRVLRPSGLLVVTVPAGQRLWSQADELAGHHRRYDLQSLDALMGRCGLLRVRAGYRFASAVLPLWLIRAWPYQRGRRLSEEDLLVSLRQELQSRPGLVTSAGRAAMGVERFLAGHEWLPFGTSLLGVYTPDRAARSRS